MFGFRGLLEFFDRTGQQSKLFTQFDMPVLQVAGCRRQIVRVDGCQRIRTPILRRTEFAVELLEPFHSATENAVLGQRLGHVCRNHAEILALQKKTGACLLIYFKNFAIPNEKGLCSWFEKSITTDIDWRKAMKYFIKLEITLPGPSAVRDLADLYKVSRTPAIFVVKPGSTMLARLMVFEYPAGGRPQPIEVPVVLEALKSRCNPAYQTLF